MAGKKLAYITLGVTVICFLISCIATLISVNCVTDGKGDCAKTSGVTACVTGCFGAALVAFAMYSGRSGRVG